MGLMDGPCNLINPQTCIDSHPASTSREPRVMSERLTPSVCVYYQHWRPLKLDKLLCHVTDVVLNSNEWSKAKRSLLASNRQVVWAQNEVKDGLQNAESKQVPSVWTKSNFMMDIHQGMSLPWTPFRRTQDQPQAVLTIRALNGLIITRALHYNHGFISHVLTMLVLSPTGWPSLTNVKA